MSKTLSILLVEDNPEDVELIRARLRQDKLDLHVFTVTTVRQAQEFFRHEHPFQLSPRPDLVLLDYLLPNGTGGEIIAWLKSDTTLARIPIVVLSGSPEPGLEVEAMAKGADLVLAKPLLLEHIIKIVQLVPEFWFSIEVNGVR